MTPIDPHQMADVTARFFNGGADDPKLGDRLALANTTVQFHFSEDAGVTLDMTKAPIHAEPEIVGDAEVHLYGSPELWLQIIRREKQAAMCITRGELAYEGPVRKWLRIVPILRSLDFSMWRELDDAPSGSASADA
jgi:hypothetical protein